MKRLLFIFILLLSCARVTSGAVTVNANTTSDCKVAANTNLDCTNLTIGAISNTVLVCAATWNLNTVSGITLTWDSLGTPQTMALITNATVSGGTFGKAELYGLVAPHTGTLNLNVTWTTTADLYVGCTAYNGANQTGGTTTFPSGVSATGTGSVTSVTISSAVGDIVEAVHTNLMATGSCSATQLWLDISLTQDSCANRGVGATTTTMTSSITTADWGAVGTNIKAAVTACKPTLTLMGVGC